MYSVLCIYKNVVIKKLIIVFADTLEPCVVKHVLILSEIGQCRMRFSIERVRIVSHCDK